MLSRMTKQGAAGPQNHDLSALADSWHLALRAERKSPETIKSYLTGVRQFIAWCEAHEDSPGHRPGLSRANLAGYIANALDAPENGGRGVEAATAVARHLAVRRFSAWLADEEEIPVDEIAGVRAPKIDEKVVDPLTWDEVNAMIKACRGRDLCDRRDEAIIRVMAETGTRASETAHIALAGLNLPKAEISIMGKGGKGRIVPIGPKACLAIDRYLRMRRGHRLADGPQLWVGDRGKGFGYDALQKTLLKRAIAAGVPNFHPHRLRHTAADNWLSAGGSEQGLMTVAGWSRPDMLLRYTKRRSSIRAIAEARTLDLGNF